MPTTRAKLTKDVVDATSPRGAPVDGRIVWDTELKGLRLRVRPTGRKTYEVMYRDKHARKRLLVLGDHGKDLTADQARKKARSALGKVADGKSPQELKAADRKALTIGDLIDLYLSDGPADKPEKRASSWDTDRANLDRHVRPLLGKELIASLRPEHISQWQAQVEAGKTAATGKSGKARGRLKVTGGRGAAARSVRTLSAMLAWAQRRQLISANPAIGVAKLKDSRRERFLTDEEAERLWGAVADLQAEGEITGLQAVAFRLLMLTGARRNEVLELRWSEVDLGRKMLILPPHRNKAGARPKSISLPEVAVDELKQLARSGEHVFPAARGESAMTPPKRAWAKVLARATLEGVSFHVLRHTLASFAVADGASLYVVGRALGHSKPETTQRYAHLRDDVAAKATETASSRYTQKQATKAVGVSRASLQRAAFVSEHGIPALVEMVDAGSVPVSAAAEVAHLPVAEQQIIVSAGPDMVRMAATDRRREKAGEIKNT